MLSPLPRNKRAKHPREGEQPVTPVETNGANPAQRRPLGVADNGQPPAAQPESINNTFAKLDLNPR
jgi:hypothetical protein